MIIIMIIMITMIIIALSTWCGQYNNSTSHNLRKGARSPYTGRSKLDGWYFCMPWQCVYYYFTHDRLNYCSLLLFCLYVHPEPKPNPSRELWPTTFAFKHDLAGVKVNQRAKYLGKRSFGCKVTVQTHKQAHTAEWLLYLDY